MADQQRPKRLVTFGAGRTENLVTKVHPEVKRHLEWGSTNVSGSITAYLEKLVYDEIERRGQEEATV